MCPKCQSKVLIEEPAIDREGAQIVYFLRCPICGFYTDKTMMKNRLNPFEPTNLEHKTLTPQQVRL